MQSQHEYKNRYQLKENIVSLRSKHNDLHCFTLTKMSKIKGGSLIFGKYFRKNDHLRKELNKKINFVPFEKKIKIKSDL